MNTLGIIFLGIGMAGFFLTLFGAMLIAIFFGTFKKIFNKKSSTPSMKNSSISLEILIAAYNEENTILQTLKSFEECVKILNKNKSNLIVNTFVGLDHCTDNTLKLVQKFQSQSEMEIKYFENNGQRGKWFILKKLIEQSSADWVALTDCGCIWNNELLLKILPRLKDEDIVCIAPSYLPTDAKFLETLYWRMEQLIRTFENIGGGSIMVHGLSVFYKREALLKAIHLLGDTHWFNDDVAIPLMLRLENPRNKISYIADLKKITWVFDIGVNSDVNVELKRRKRILIGNLQIIKNLIIPRFNFFRLSSWSSLRLIFKALWAFWATFLIMGMILILSSTTLISDFVSHQSFSKIIIELLFAFFIFYNVKKSNYLHRLFMAYLSGLNISKSWKAIDNTNSITWS